MEPDSGRRKFLAITGTLIAAEVGEGLLWAFGDDACQLEDARSLQADPLADARLLGSWTSSWCPVADTRYI